MSDTILGSLPPGVPLGRDDGAYLRDPKPGRQWTERRLLAALKWVLKGLGLPVKLHTFRHTFVSNALLNGRPVAVVKEGGVGDNVHQPCAAESRSRMRMVAPVARLAPALAPPRCSVPGSCNRER